jgi:tight adherence protein B
MSDPRSSLRRLRVLRLASGALGVALFAGAWASSGASAQDEPSPDRIVLRAVDSTDTDAVTMVYGWSGDAAVGASPAIEENRDDVAATVVPSVDAGFGNDIVFVVDTSGTTNNNAMLVSASAAIGEWVASLPPGHRASVVVAGAATQRIVGLTSDVGRLGAAVEGLTPVGDGALLAGVVRAAGTLEPQRGSIPTVVLFTDGVIDSTITRERAEGALTSIGAALYVVGLQDGGLDEGLFGGMATATGGRMVVTDDSQQIPALSQEIRPEIDQQFAATWASPESSGIQDLTVAVGDATVQGSYISGSELVGAPALEPRPAVEPTGLSFFHNSLGKWIGFMAAAAACLLFAYGVVSLFIRDDTLTAQLQPYGEGYVAASEDDDDDDASKDVTQTAFLQRAVGLTEAFAQRQGFLTRVERNLEKADVPLRAGEAMFFYFAGVVLIGVASIAFLQNFIGVIIVLLIAILIPPALLNFKAAQKKKKFESLLPDTLQLLSSTLRAGYSMMQGVEAVSQEAQEPMGKELRRVVTEARLGRPLEESLEAIAVRMESADFAWAVMAIRIQREVGGNLAELLLTVAETMTERERLRRDIRSLTAEGRMSAYVLIALPIGMLAFLYLANREYMQILFDRTVGQGLLGFGIILMVGGYLWMRKIINIEV